MILDYTDRFGLPKTRDKDYTNELTTLRYLARGLWFLYETTTRIETEFAKQLNPDMNVLLYGNDPLLRSAPQDLVLCFFHWYAVSVCNYVRLVGWLRRNLDANAPSPTDYVQTVIPLVRAWRDKVAAHLSRASNHSLDTPAEQEASVLYQLCWSDDAFFVPAFTITLTRGGAQSSSQSMKRWSLTKVHEGLRTRYWPADAKMEVPP